jgi:hypothetical protein
MKHIATFVVCLALMATALVVTRVAPEVRAAVPPQSKAYGKTLTEWMQLFETWFIGGAVGEDHVGHVKFLPLPPGDYAGGSFTYADPGILVGHLDVSLRPGTPFVLPVTVWYGESYEPVLGYPDDPALPADLFTDPAKNQISVYVDGNRVMDSTIASVSPFYFGPAPISVIYSQPSSYGSVAAIFVQGIGFVNEPLSVGTHTIQLLSGLRVPIDPAILNLSVYPEGSGVVYMNTWTITVSPE